MFLFDRSATDDFEVARKIVGEGTTRAELARFWRLHHPDHEKQKLKELLPILLKVVEGRLGAERYWGDLKSRGGAFVATLGERYPDAVRRNEDLD